MITVKTENGDVLVEDVKLIQVSDGYSQAYKAKYLRFRVLINDTPIEKLFSKEELKNLAYWSNRSKVMSMTVWGAGQEFEAREALGAFLGIPRSPWTEFTEEIEKFKVI